MSITGGRKGQCLDQPNGCDHETCRWKGTLTVDNTSGTDADVFIKLAGVTKKTCNNVSAGSECQWDFSSDANSINIDCSDAVDTTKVVSVKINPDGESPTTNTVDLKCRKCAP